MNYPKIGRVTQIDEKGTGISQWNKRETKGHSGKWMNVFQFVMYHVNRRPIGISSTLESVRPADILSVWSKVNPSVSMAGCTKTVERAK